MSCGFCNTLNRVDLDRVADRPVCGNCARPMLLDRPIRVGDDDFDRVITGTDAPIIVDFYADWCAPCKFMAPIFDDLAREYAGRVLFTKLDTDHSPGVSARFGIRGIPTLIVFRNGAEHARQVGAVPRPRLEAMIAEALRPA